MPLKATILATLTMLSTVSAWASDAGKVTVCKSDDGKTVVEAYDRPVAVQGQFTGLSEAVISLQTENAYKAYVIGVDVSVDVDKGFFLTDLKTKQVVLRLTNRDQALTAEEKAAGKTLKMNLTGISPQTGREIQNAVIVLCEDRLKKDQ